MKHFDSIDLDGQASLGTTNYRSRDVSSLTAAGCLVIFRLNAGTRANNPTSYGDVRRARTQVQRRASALSARDCYAIRAVILPCSALYRWTIQRRLKQSLQGRGSQPFIRSIHRA